MKALSLFSGGLDSLLVIKILQKQGIDVTGICFISSFFDAEKAKAIAVKNDFKLRTVDIKTGLLDLVKDPPSGHGKNLNPCVDCHSLMIKKAGEIARLEGFDIVSTGEVLGQRPFSQNKESLKKVKKLSGVDVLRPLSAKLLEETEAERRGFVDREKLYDIKGRSRDKQKELLEEFAIVEYPSPAGGCVLTDRGFCERLSAMLENWPDCDYTDVDLLRHGRIFWLSFKNKKVLVVVGRHRKDNEMLKKLAKKGDFVVELKEVTGPVAVARIVNIQYPTFSNSIRKITVPGKIPELQLLKNDIDSLVGRISELVGYYAKKVRGQKNIKVKIEKK
jgi:tRNA-uridine 2-sulfurtransferase